MAGARGSDSASRAAAHSQGEPLALIALVGAPRSGTTWLQTLLASHDAIVSPQETNLFSRYVAPLEERWRYEARGSVAERQQRRFTGLGAVLTEAEFHTEIGHFVNDVLRAIAALKPGATIVVEKTPSHSLHVDLIARHVPQARFVHIVRDGRDVAASLVAASQGWGKAWGAPSSVGAAARTWRNYVVAAREAQALGPYHEVRYEVLRAGGHEAAAALEAVFGFCGVAPGGSEAAERLDRFALGASTSERGIVIGGEAAAHESAAREPEGFVRRGRVGGWQDWNVAERVEFDVAAGPLLAELGYTQGSEWLGPAGAVRRARRSVAARGRLARVQRAVAGRLVRSAARLEP
ncbi:MAG TPA: sulfotransferase [Acidimicrobiia bacterium]|jgi:hypothetical protein